MAKKILLLLPVGVFLVLYLFINSILGLDKVWLGFLIMWYWGMEKKADLSKLITSIFPGAILGVGLTFMLHNLPGYWGFVGVLISAVTMIFVVLCTFTGWFKSFINGATFLLLTVLNIPGVSENVGYLEYIKVIFIAVVYFGLASWIMEKLRSKKRRYVYL